MFLAHILHLIEKVSSTTNHQCCKFSAPFKKSHVFEISISYEQIYLQNRRNLSTYDDISIVQVYYGLPESKLFTADVLMTWQEIVSK